MRYWLALLFIVVFCFILCFYQELFYHCFCYFVTDFVDVVVDLFCLKSCNHQWYPLQSAHLLLFLCFIIESTVICSWYLMQCFTTITKLLINLHIKPILLLQLFRHFLHTFIFVFIFIIFIHIWIIFIIIIKL